MKFTDVRNIILNEEEITTIYKGANYRIVKEGSSNGSKILSYFC